MCNVHIDVIRGQCVQILPKQSGAWQDNNRFLNQGVSEKSLIKGLSAEMWTELDQQGLIFNPRVDLQPNGLSWERRLPESESQSHQRSNRELCNGGLRQRIIADLWSSSKSQENKYSILFPLTELLPGLSKRNQRGQGNFGMQFLKGSLRGTMQGRKEWQVDGKGQKEIFYTIQNFSLEFI